MGDHQCQEGEEEREGGARGGRRQFAGSSTSRRSGEEQRRRRRQQQHFFLLLLLSRNFSDSVCAVDFVRPPLRLGVLNGHEFCRVVFKTQTDMAGNGAHIFEGGNGSEIDKGARTEEEAASAAVLIQLVLFSVSSESQSIYSNSASGRPLVVAFPATPQNGFRV